MGLANVPFAQWHNLPLEVSGTGNSFLELVAGAAEGALDRIPDSGLVFDQKDTHLCRVYERVR